MKKIEEVLEGEITRGNCEACPKRFKNTIDGLDYCEVTGEKIGSGGEYCELTPKNHIN